MLIQIEKLKRRPRQIVINEQATDFPVLRDLIEHGSVSFTKEISGALEVSRSGEVIEVKGHLQTTMVCPCDRCLLPVSGRLDVPVELCYAGKEEAVEPPAEEVELRSEELGLIPVSGQEIDLKPDLEQEIVMALPHHPLCQEACQGLCPVCGCNLNRDQCDCVPATFHSGLAALKDFKV